MYELRDISVIIPTYNRVEDLEKTIKSFLPNLNGLNEVIVVDQSNNKETESLIKSLRNKKIKYFYSDKPSLTRARNFGISKISKGTKIVIFLDDDVNLHKDYFNKILEVFNEHSECLGVSGYYHQKINDVGFFDNFIRKIFFIEHSAAEKSEVLSAYGQVHPSRLSEMIESQWLSGFNMAYKKEIFDEFLFDENLSRYSLAEDFDFSYRVYKKYPGSLFITPYAGIVHRVSIIERYPTKKASYMNQVHHIYLNFKNFNRNSKEKFIFIWCIFGISLLRTINFAIKRDSVSAAKLKFFFSSLFFSLVNISRIRKGKIVEVLSLAPN